MTEQELLRRESLAKLRELGIDPYPAEMFDVTAFASDITANYQEEILEDGTKNRLNYQSVALAGRIMASREAGKAMFMNLQDSSGRIQLYLRRDDFVNNAGVTLIHSDNTTDAPLFDIAIKKLLDLGDYVGVKGFAFRTKTGEVSVHVQEFKFLAKSLRPLPVVKKDAEGHVFDAFTDPELRYRMRYVDLTVNTEFRQIFIKRTKLIKTMRNYLDELGLLEVETPILQPIHGGAAARPFTTHHNTLDMKLYLRIANELYLKRLIVAGFDGVYEFAKMFRNEGMDRTHNPEFTALEFYVAYKDYNWMMDVTEIMLEKVARAIHEEGGSTTQVGENVIEFAGPYRRLTMFDAIQEYTGLNVETADEMELRSYCKKEYIEIDASMGKAKLIDEIFGEKVEAHLIQPTFLIDYPMEMSPLTKKHRIKPGLVERFELFVNGKEVANAYSELNDPIDQRERFEEQLSLAERGDEEAMAMDEDFLRALEYGMPPTAGIGFGIDRLAMMFTGQASIQEVLFFPQMRPEMQSTPDREINQKAKPRVTSSAKFVGHGFNSESGISVGNQLIRFLADNRFRAFTWFSAFASESAIVGLSEHIELAKGNYHSMNIVVGVDQKGTSKEALEAILKLGVNAFVFYQPAFSIFHPKVYLFESEEISEVIVGSSNLTTQGLFVNVEASMMVRSEHAKGENPEVISKLKTYFKGIFDFTDPNLKPLTQELIETLVKAKIVPTEQERRDIQDKSDEAGQNQISTSVSSVFPKRNIPQVPSEFRVRRKETRVNQPSDASIPSFGSTVEQLALGELVWSKRKLSSSDAQSAKEGTNPTGALRLVQSGFEVDEQVINQTVYFRNTLFGGFEWKKVTDNPYVEVAKITFSVIIKRENIGEFQLEVRHKPSGEAGQGNYTTSISWGELGEIIRSANLVGAQLDLYAPLHAHDPFVIEIF